MERQPFEDVSPIQNGDFPLFSIDMLVLRRVSGQIGLQVLNLNS